MVAAPRCPFQDPGNRERLVSGLDHDLREEHGVVSSRLRVGRRRHEQVFEEQLAEYVVMAVQLAVGRDQGGGGRAIWKRRAGEARSDPLEGEPVGVISRGRLERDR